MGRIAGKLTNLPERHIEPADHVVEHTGQAPDLVGRGRDGQPLTEIAGGDALGRQRDGVDRPQRAAGQKPSAGQ